jgi:hypothetical protein
MLSSKFNLDQFYVIREFAVADGAAFLSEMGEVCARRNIDLGVDLPEDAFDFGSHVPSVSRDVIG